VSLSTLSSIAAQRDKGSPRRAKAKPKTPEEVRATQERGYLNVLVSAIPTEPLALYTFLTAGIVATIDAGESERLGLRWGIYAAMVVFIIAWLWSAYARSATGAAKKRRFPVAETATAVVAFAAWGLVMPESPLNAELAGDDRVVWTLVITVAGAGLVGLLGVHLKDPVKK
jgi:hypothetical protein